MRPDSAPSITSSLIDPLLHPSRDRIPSGGVNVVQAADVPWDGEPSTDTRNNVCVQMYTSREMMR